MEQQEPQPAVACPKQWMTAATNGYAASCCHWLTVMRSMLHNVLSLDSSTVSNTYHLRMLTSFTINNTTVLYYENHSLKKALIYLYR